jgi:hypothetical protein
VRRARSLVICGDATNGRAPGSGRERSPANRTPAARTAARPAHAPCAWTARSQPRGRSSGIRLAGEDWRRRPESNRRMRVLQTLALPLGYVAAEAQKAATSAASQLQRRPIRVGRSSSDVLERETGFEPATPTLARLCSTTELFPRRSGRYQIARAACQPCPLAAGARPEGSQQKGPLQLLGEAVRGGGRPPGPGWPRAWLASPSGATLAGGRRGSRPALRPVSGHRSGRTAPSRGRKVLAHRLPAVPLRVRSRIASEYPFCRSPAPGLPASVTRAR